MRQGRRGYCSPARTQGRRQPDAGPGYLPRNHRSHQGALRRDHSGLDRRRGRHDASRTSGAGDALARDGDAVDGHGQLRRRRVHESPGRHAKVRPRDATARRQARAGDLRHRHAHHRQPLAEERAAKRPAAFRFCARHSRWHGRHAAGLAVHGRAVARGCDLDGRRHWRRAVAAGHAGNCARRPCARRL